MKILIVSDSHRDNQKLDLVYKKHPNMDYYLHAGDSESSPYDIHPFLSVKGNCDRDTSLNHQLKLNTPYGYLLMKHIGEVSLDTLKRNNIKIFIFGHTHRRAFSKIDDIYFINPGSISLPRDSFGLSYAILEIDKDGVKVDFLKV